MELPKLLHEIKMTKAFVSEEIHNVDNVVVNTETKQQIDEDIVHCKMKLKKLRKKGENPNYLKDKEKSAALTAKIGEQD